MMIPAQIMVMAKQYILSFNDLEYQGPYDEDPVTRDARLNASGAGR